MKTLDEIINRKDYVRINESLKRRSSELAPIFAKKFYELTDFAWRDKTEYPKFAVQVNNHSYCAIVTRTIGGVIDAMSFVRVYDSTYKGGWEYFFNYDDLFQCCNYSVLLDFLNDAKDILKELSEMEDERVKEAEEALKNAKAV